MTELQTTFQYRKKHALIKYLFNKALRSFILQEYGNIFYTARIWSNRIASKMFTESEKHLLADVLQNS